MKNKKNIISIILIIICILIIIYLSMFAGTKKSSKNKSATKYYLVMDNFANLVYLNHTWQKTSIHEIEEYSKKYVTYSNNHYLGEYSLKYGNIWNLFDANDEFVNYENTLFAYSDNFDLEKVNINIRSINDQELSEISNNFHYSNFNYLISNDVIDIDLDHNGITDQIICISNMGEGKINENQYYNLVYIKLNNQFIQIINENSSNCDILKTGIYNLSYIFSTNKNHYLVLKKTTGVVSDSPMEDIIMYDYTNIDKIKKVKIN